MLPQPLVTVPEEPGDGGTQWPSRQAEPRLPADPIGDQAAAGGRLEGAFVVHFIVSWGSILTFAIGLDAYPGSAFASALCRARA